MKILIAEDERPIAQLVKMCLESEGYECVCAKDGKEAADIIETQHFDLALLDIMLPEIDGYELMEYIKYYETPVIFLTAKSGVSDKVKGLKLGADDYITKPFELAELSARVETVLRRYNKTEKTMRFSDIEIDCEARTVTKGGREINLTAKEFELLCCFARCKNKALRRERLYYEVWGGDFSGESRTVDLHVQRLRKKLGLEKALVPVYKVGYRLEVRD